MSCLIKPGSQYEVDRNDCVKGNSVLRHQGTTLQLYFRERIRRRSFFEAHANRYAGFTWEHWTFLGEASDGNNAYVKVAPHTDREREALEALLRFALSGR